MITEQDKRFLDFIKEHKSLGYGRMMQIISHTWYEQLKREHPGAEDGAFTGTCVAFLPEELKREYFAVLQSEKEQGMNY